MKSIKNILGILLVLCVLIGIWFSVTWAISSWSDTNQTKKIENCYSIVGSEINNDTKVESICAKLYPSGD